MNPIHKKLSSIVQTQLPVFYQEYGPLFVDFLYSYYLWLEETGQLTSITRNLPEYKAIDTTEDEFLKHFKRKYLVGVELTDTDGIRRLIKNARFLYDSKGSDRAIKLLFKLLYEDSVSVTYPNDQVLKPSYGDWEVPQYLELIPSPNTSRLVGKQITGSISGSTAFGESFARRENNGRYYDVLFVSKPIGDFIQGEQIVVENEYQENPPVVYGSLTDIEIVEGGANNAVGDLFTATSDFGRGAILRVANVENATGRVSFTLEDGGYGYTMNAETTVSEYVLAVSSFSANLTQFETVVQDVANIAVATNNPSGWTVDTQIQGFVVPGNTLVANGYIVSATTNATHAILKVQVSNGSFATATDIGSVGNSLNSVLVTVSNVMATANLIGFTSNSVGVVNVTNTLYPSSNVNTFIRGLSSNSTASFSAKSTGTSADFSIANITSTETLYLFTDRLAANNTGGIPFINISANGVGSNVGFVSRVVVAKKCGHTPLFGYSQTFLNTEQIDQCTVANSGAVYAGTVTAHANDLIINGSGTSFNLQFVENDYLAISNTTATDLIKITTIANSTFLYINRPSRVLGSGLSYGKGLIVAKGLNANANSTFITTYDSNNTLVTGTSSANLIIGANSYALSSLDSIALLGGSAYDNATTVGTFANGAPTSPATFGSVTTNSIGGLVSVTLSANGSGYNGDANIAFSVAGTGANVKVIMNYGYGFPKLPSAGPYNKILDALSSNTFTIGTITGLANINPGTGYNRKPIVAVIEPLIAGFGRRGFIGQITDVVGSFLVGETITQNVGTSVVSLTFTGISGNTAFAVGESLYEGNSSVSTAIGYVTTTNSTVVVVANVVGTFAVTSNTFTQIKGSTSNGLANVTVVTPGVSYSTSRGVITEAQVPATHIHIKRTAFSQNFTLNTTITGSTSGATANLVYIQEDTNTLPIGFNANVTANVVTANGVATMLEIVDSGFGYRNGELLTITNEDNDYIITGYSNTAHMGTGQGRYTSHRGWLNEAIVHDNDRYQAQSYVINSGLSLDKYETVVKQILHVAGTRLFGDVHRESAANVVPSIQSSSVSVS